jgi:bacillolysin
MPKGFHKVSFSAAAPDDDQRRRAAGIRSLGERNRMASDQLSSRQFGSDEAAARFYMSGVMDTDDRPSLRAMTAPDRAELMPDMRLRTIQAVPRSAHRLIVFDQTKSSIPVFGSRVVVELDTNRELVDISGDVAEFEPASSLAGLSPIEALQAVAAFAGVETERLQKVQPPQLVFFHREEDGSWHLAYQFVKVPAAPAEFLNDTLLHRSCAHLRGASHRAAHPAINYLVDAHDGEILFFYSAKPMMAAVLPSMCNGLDEFGKEVSFYGKEHPGGYEMVDPRRQLRTFDLAGGDIDAVPLPAAPVRNAQAKWLGANKAAVSAHVHAAHVYDFFKSVLFRDSVDDKGMELISIVNCTSPQDEAPPEWHNAMWWDNKMWYGQEHNAGNFSSYSRFLDIIAHELTHGVTEHTSNLVYKGESGALNESFSDIFGVVIANWDKTDPNRPVSGWRWEIGSGLGGPGKPLRDMSNPTLTGDPDHMNKYYNTTSDHGGVHTNSNIHNKAAYNLFTSKDAAGKYVFRPMELAEICYLCLSRLSSRATFSDALEEMVRVATTFYSGDPAAQARNIQAIKEAYRKVGVV